MEARNRPPARVLYLSWNRVVILKAIYEVANHRITEDGHSWFQRRKERSHPSRRRTIIVTVVKRKVCNQNCPLGRGISGRVPNLNETVTNLLHPRNSARLELTPVAAIPLKQPFGCFGPPRSRRVVREVGVPVLGPRFEQRRKDGPGRFYTVSMCKQCCISKHRIKQKALVSVSWVLPKASA
jgi:hypothetical protein